jgi:hypothetical protein
MNPRDVKPKAWPEPKVLNPDIANPTGIPYIDCLIDRLLDAQQDINLAANEFMDQPLCGASELLEEIELCIRRLALTAAGYTIAPTGGVEAGEAAKIVRQWADWIICVSADMDEPEWPTSGAQGVRDKRDVVLAALASPNMPVPAGWQTMDTAPKDGTIVELRSATANPVIFKAGYVRPKGLVAKLWCPVKGQKVGVLPWKDSEIDAWRPAAPTPAPDKAEARRESE